MLIGKVFPGTAAETAGFKKGDIIAKFAGKPLEGGEDLLKKLGKQTPGDEVELTLNRDGWEKTIKLKLAKRPAAWRAPEPRYRTGALAKYARLVGSAAEGAVTSA